jgi:hypothetical protein
VPEAQRQHRRRQWLIALAGAAMFGAAVGSDFVIRSFWARHAMLTSLLASLLVVVVTVAVVNQALALREQRRWALLAQSVLFALVQNARATWTGLVEVLGVIEVRTGSNAGVEEGIAAALDAPRVSAAARRLLADPKRRQRLARAADALDVRCAEVIARWAPVMVGAAAYAELLDGHVELSGRLGWLSSVLSHNEPAPDQDWRQRRLVRASVAAEQADEVDDDWLHDMIVATTRLAAHLDRDSHQAAFALVSGQWWIERTRALTTP